MCVMSRAGSLFNVICIPINKTAFIAFVLHWSEQKQEGKIRIHSHVDGYSVRGIEQQGAFLSSEEGKGKKEKDGIDTN